MGTRRRARCGRVWGECRRSRKSLPALEPNRPCRCQSQNPPTHPRLLRPNRHAWDPDGRPEHLRRALEGSLKRLKLDRIDLYQLHAPDPKVPFEDSVGVLAELQRAGKIRHIGISKIDY